MHAAMLLGPANGVTMHEIPRLRPDSETGQDFAQDDTAAGSRTLSHSNPCRTASIVAYFAAIGRAKWFGGLHIHAETK